MIKLYQILRLIDFFSIIADEASDSSNKEQLSLVLRYVDTTLIIKEDFVGYIHCAEGLSGKKLANYILKAISDFNLDIKDCRGQGYDGAGSVAGHQNGCSAHILRINNKALYTHCFSHRLNLAICKACCIQFIRNVFDQIKDISYFFNYSEPRQNLLIKNIKEFCPESSKLKLIDVCRTRWIARVDGLGVFQNLYVALVNTFEEMSFNQNRCCNNETSKKATNFLKLITNFEFVVSLVISRSVLDRTLPVTKLLKSKTNDVLDGIHLIESLKTLASTMRQNIDHFHSTWYAEAITLSMKVNVDETKPRTCNRQSNRPNQPAENTSDYFKRSVTIPFIDHLINQLDIRFDDSTMIAYHGLAVVPAKLISYLNKVPKLNWKEKFMCFANFYKDDFPNFLTLDGELDLRWRT